MVSLLHSQDWKSDLQNFDPSKSPISLWEGHSHGGNPALRRQCRPGTSVPFLQYNANFIGMITTDATEPGIP